MFHTSDARLLPGTLLGLMLALSGCGGSSGDGESSGTAAPSSGPTDCASATDCGTLYLALTDVDGDFPSYTVDVRSLTLKRADGAIVQSLPVSTRVDFAQYVELTEFLTAATVPLGTYVEGSLQLDYRTAEVTVESAGEPVAATVVDASGTAPGVVDVKVVLDNRHRLVVGPGRPALLVLDFDLAASHTVDLATVPATVTASPTLIASLEPVEEKELRLRGPLASVDPAAGTYVIDVSPFHDRQARLGRVTIHTASDTRFEVNGVCFEGAAGLEALATAGSGTPTVAFGTLTTSERRFEAARVHAGSSVPGAGMDAVLGNVLARSSDQLVVRGATIVRSADGARFARSTIRVLLGPDTGVLKDGQGSSSMLAAAAISVGQRIAAFGQLHRDGENWVLDATQGRVRLHITHLFGTVLSANPGAVTLDLAAIDGRPVSVYDFSGTGVTADQDADPDAYQVATGDLELSGLPMDQSVRVFGFVEPFGLAPPDFAGRTIVADAALGARMLVGWGETGTAAPFLSLGPDGLLVDLANSDLGVRHHLRVAMRVVDLTQLPAAPRIVPVAGGWTAYVIRVDGVNHVFRSFADFAEQLTQHLDGSTRMSGFGAAGNYDVDANELRAWSAIAILD